MGVSVGGTFTLLFLIVIGPLIYGSNWAYQKFRPKDDEDYIEPVKEDGSREELSSKQYLFALVGYAIGEYYIAREQCVV